MPKPNPGESKEDYIARFMSSKEAKKSYPGEKQRLAVAHSYWKKHHEMGSINFNYNVAIEEMGMVDSDFIIAGTAINATVTSNNHKFLPEVLEESAKTLIGVPLLVDHENKVENIKGRVFYAGYDAPNQRIPFKAKVMDNDIKSMIKDGRLNSVSVGAMVNPKDIEEDSDGCLIPHNIIFKELSLVAVPADQGATFNIAMNQAYKTFKDDEEIDIDDLEPEEIEEQMSEDEMRKMMKKKGMSDEEIEKAIKMRKAKSMDHNQSQIKSDSSIIERRENMDEQKTEIVEKIVEKVEVKEDKSAELIKSMSEKIEALNKKLSEMEAKKIKEEDKAKDKKEEEDESEEETIESYKILQGVGSLKGGSFTMIRNKYK